MEDDVGLLEPAFALDVDLVVAVDQDVGDRRDRAAALERSQSEHLVQHVADRGFTLEQAEGRRSLSRSSMPMMSERISGSASSRLTCASAVRGSAG